jgi:hypothetical protein
LGYENISKDIPKKIKKESLSQEDEITKQLYKDYSLFKRVLFNNLTELNPDVDPLLLFKKSQKLLDRFLFLFFAEDRHLLPPNSVRMILKQWKQLKELDAYTPLYDRFKKYFSYLNTGFKGKQYDVYPYNGGLFKADDILDTINIDDDLLYKHTLKLSEYDFDSEVDVNILGHIFENSLNEIEEIQNKLEENLTEKVSISKRKKDGVFYTPKYITKYIVENTVGKLCGEQKDKLEILDEEYTFKRQKKTKETLLEKLKTYRQWLLELTIVDPACGSGAFLNEALNYLIVEHQYLDELETKLMGGGFVFPNVENSILEHNLFGVDINNESVEIAKLSLWLRTAQPNRKLNDLSNNIKCGNSLIDDPEVAGDKAFNWEKEFPQVFVLGGFDVVIGNPPYVRVQNLNYKEVDFYKKTKSTAFKRIDISTIFFEDSYKILKQNGRLCFITSNQFQTTEYGQETRRFLMEKYRIDKIIDYGDLPVFEGALTYVSIYCLSKNKPSDFLYKKLSSIAEGQIGNFKGFLKIGIDSLSHKKWSLVSEIELKLLNKLEGYDKLEEYGNAWAGLFTGLDEIMMFDKEDMENSGIESGIFLPIIRANDPIRNGLARPSKYVIYPYEEIEGKTVVLSENKLIERFPKCYEYLNTHKKRLQARKDSRKTFEDRKDWYALTRFGRKNIFKQSKIVSPGEVKEHKFSLDETGSGFSCARVFAITLNNEIPILGLLAILNSKLLKFFLQRKSSLKAGGYYSYSSKVLNNVPLPSSIDSTLISLLEEAINFNQEFLEISSKFERSLQREFPKELEKLSKKLQNWYELSFADFIKEFQKKKINSSLAQKAEWEDYFLAEQQKAIDLKTKIDATDNEIDQMIYELYGLTEEEIKIVEES